MCEQFAQAMAVEKPSDVREGVAKVSLEDLDLAPDLLHCPSHPLLKSPGSSFLRLLLFGLVLFYICGCSPALWGISEIWTANGESRLTISSAHSILHVYIGSYTNFIRFTV